MKTSIRPTSTRAASSAEAESARQSEVARLLRSLLRTTIPVLAAVMATIAIAGCNSEKEGSPQGQTPGIATSDSEAEKVLTSSELRYSLKANNNATFRREGNDIVGADLSASGISDIDELKGVPLRMLSLFRTDVSDLSPLKGMKLERLDLGFTKVADLSPLAGMPLTELVLESSLVTDISALKGMPLEVAQFQNLELEPGQFDVLKEMPIRELNLMGVPVSDLKPFNQLPIESMWLPLTKVTDLSPLKDMKLVSLDIADTEVTDLSPLSEMTSLKRLNINGSAVTDLTPLAGLRLERLTLDPGTITAGMDAMKEMTSLAQIGPPPQPFTPTSMPSAQFWPRYEVGAWEELDLPTLGGDPETPDGETPDGDPSPSETPDSETPDSETPEGEAPAVDQPEPDGEPSDPEASSNP